MAGIFGEFFLVSVSHKTKREKSYVLHNGVSHRRACVKLSTNQEGLSHHSWGAANLPAKVSRDMGHN